MLLEKLYLLFSIQGLPRCVIFPCHVHHCRCWLMDHLHFSLEDVAFIISKRISVVYLSVHRTVFHFTLVHLKGALAQIRQQCFWIMSIYDFFFACQYSKLKVRDAATKSVLRFFSVKPMQQLVHF